MKITVLIYVLWLGFLAYWLISARGVKQNVQRPWHGIVVRFLLAIAVVAFWRTSYSRRLRTIGQASSTHLSVVGIIGLLLCVLGISLAIWARRHLGRNWGMPMSIKENPELVTTGPYEFVRHPIYGGILIALLGSALTGGVWLVLLVLFGAYFVYSAKTEEKRLARQMPDQYPAYVRRTKMLIPFIY